MVQFPHNSMFSSLLFPSLFPFSSVSFIFFISSASLYLFVPLFYSSHTINDIRQVSFSEANCLHNKQFTQLRFCGSLYSCICHTVFHHSCTAPLQSIFRTKVTPKEVVTQLAFALQSLNKANFSFRLSKAFTLYKPTPKSYAMQTTLAA